MHITPILPPNPVEELARNRKLAEQVLNDKELYDLGKGKKREASRKERGEEKLSDPPNKIGHYILYVLFGVGIIGIVTIFFIN